MYLSREAVKMTLGSLHALCAPGSVLAMDFWHMLDGPDVRATLHRMSPHLLHLVGEPVTFGIHPEDVGGLLASRGWQLEDLADAAELARRYVRDGRRLYPPSYLVRARRIS